MHIHKTGALIRASVLMGAACGPCDAGAWAGLSAYGAAPLAFQWQRLNPGAADFADVPGAVTSSFTIAATVLAAVVLALVSVRATQHGEPMETVRGTA